MLIEDVILNSIRYEKLIYHIVGVSTDEDIIEYSLNRQWRIEKGNLPFGKITLELVADQAILRNRPKELLKLIQDSIGAQLDKLPAPPVISNPKITNTEILMFICGWQGGTLKQLAKFLKISEKDILEADYDRMQILCRKAQEKRNERDFSKI